MRWLPSIPPLQILYILLTGITGLLLPVILLVASIELKAAAAIVIGGLFYIFGEAIFEWFFRAARDTFRPSKCDYPPNYGPIRYPHAKVAAFAIFAAISFALILA